MYAQLGNTIFQGLKGFTEFSESRSTNLAQHARIEGKPRLQRVGSNLTELSISILLHASFCNPEQEFQALDAAREDAEVLPLLLGNGTYAGDFVIESIERGVEVSDATGNVISQGLSLSLLEAASEDQAKRLQMQARQSAFATSSGGATPLRVLKPLPPTLGQAALREVTATQLLGTSIEQDVATAATIPNRQPFLSTRMGGTLTQIEGTVLSLQAKVVDPAISAYQGGIVTAATRVYTAVQDFRSVLPITSLPTVQTASAALLAAITALKDGSAILANAIAARKL